MKKLTDWIKRHQVVAFFIITFAITWGLGFSYGAVLYKGQFLLAPLVFVATCGPALAGIIITAISNTQPRQGTRKAFWIAFFMAWVVSALVCPCQHHVHQPCSIIPRHDRLHLRFGGAGSLCDQHGLFAHPGSENATWLH